MTWFNQRISQPKQTSILAWLVAMLTLLTGLALATIPKAQAEGEGATDLYASAEIDAITVGGVTLTPDEVTRISPNADDSATINWHINDSESIRKPGDYINLVLDRNIRPADDLLNRDFPLKRQGTDTVIGNYRFQKQTDGTYLCHIVFNEKIIEEDQIVGVINYTVAYDYFSGYDDGVDEKTGQHYRNITISASVGVPNPNGDGVIVPGNGHRFPIRVTQPVREPIQPAKTHINADVNWATKNDPEKNPRGLSLKLERVLWGITLTRPADFAPEEPTATVTVTDLLWKGTVLDLEDGNLKYVVGRYHDGPKLDGDLVYIDSTLHHSYVTPNEEYYYTPIPADEAAKLIRNLRVSSPTEFTFETTLGVDDHYMIAYSTKADEERYGEQDSQGNTASLTFRAGDKTTGLGSKDNIVINTNSSSSGYADGVRGVVPVFKTNTEHTPLAGAEFTLWRIPNEQASNYQPGQVVDLNSPDGEGASALLVDDNKVATKATNEVGYAVFKAVPLRNRKYFLQETKTPAGYADPHSLTVVTATAISNELLDDVYLVEHHTGQEPVNSEDIPLLTKAITDGHTNIVNQKPEQPPVDPGEVTPPQPVDPTDPVTPENPVTPVNPDQPAQPEQPEQPVNPNPAPGKPELPNTGVGQSEQANGLMLGVFGISLLIGTGLITARSYHR